MSEQESEITAILDKLRQNHPSGFAIALHVTYSAPKYLFQAYDRNWIETYTKEGLVLTDPTVKWGFSNTGTIRWGDLVDPADAAGMEMMFRAAAHGLVHGFTVAHVEGGTRTIASFTRSDREVSEDEIDVGRMAVERLHALTSEKDGLSESLHESLKALSISLTRG